MWLFAANFKGAVIYITCMYNSLCTCKCMYIHGLSLLTSTLKHDVVHFKSCTGIYMYTCMQMYVYISYLWAVRRRMEYETEKRSWDSGQR